MQEHEGAALPEDARQQVVSYLRHQASKSIDDLLALIDRAEGVIDRSLDGVSEAQSQFCPEPGEWSVADVLCHVQTSFRATGRIIATLAAGGKADAKGIEPVIEAGTETLRQLRRGVAQSFDDLRAAVRTIPEGATSGATAYHPFFGDLTCKEWTAFIYVHARDHVDQIEKVKAAPGYPS